jgi:anaerobic magnesium-protoporphyrin IX monomethyl ester cyclase
LNDTVRHVRELWDIAEGQPGRFRASVFEFRPYPGTPEWHRLTTAGRYDPGQLLRYTAVDLTGSGLDEAMRSRDEFNFSVNIQFGEPPSPRSATASSSYPANSTSGIPGHERAPGFLRGGRRT